MKKILSLFTLLSCITLGCFASEGAFPGESTPIKQHTLVISNDTHSDDGAPGRDLFLVWGGDVYNSPQITKRLQQGAFDAKQSRDIGYGGNFRHFDIDVYRWKKGEKKFIGRFIHSIYAPPFGNGHKEYTRIFKDYYENAIWIGREWYNPRLGKKEREYIGSISREEW